MTRYLCHNCGERFESNKPFMCGLEFVEDFKEGDVVPDILVFLCEECKEKISK